jgi:hypothetical protein
MPTRCAWLPVGVWSHLPRATTPCKPCSWTTCRTIPLSSTNTMRSLSRTQKPFAGRSPYARFALSTALSCLSQPRLVRGFAPRCILTKKGYYKDEITNCFPRGGPHSSAGGIGLLPAGDQCLARQRYDRRSLLGLDGPNTPDSGDHSRPRGLALGPHFRFLTLNAAYGNIIGPACAAKSGPQAK